MRSIEARGCVLACILTACWLLPYSETYGSEGSISEPSAKATDSESFQPTELRVPEGFHVELAAGPPLVTHPTMACFDDQGRLYVCNNAGVNMGNEELEEHLPNAIHRLVDTDGDGKFDSFTVFADKLTVPMGGAWHDGAVYVASPPNIWRLRDTDGDGVADERIILVSRFGYNGNAASIHGCFFGPDGRLYWTDGYHGHEFKDPQGNEKTRPVLVISATEDIPSEEEPHRLLVGVAISTAFHKPLDPNQVPLPWAANGSARSGLRRECVAVCKWIVTLRPEDVIEVKGVVSGRILDEVLSRLPSVG